MEVLYDRLGALGARLTALEFSASGKRDAAHVQALALVAEARSLVAAVKTAEGRDTTETQTPMQGTPCVGPCRHLWEGASRDRNVRVLVRLLFEVESGSDARALYKEVMQLKPPSAQPAARYRVCRLTGFPCSVFQEQEQEEHETLEGELHRECLLMLEYANHVAAIVR